MFQGILLAVLSASCYATLVIFGKIGLSMGLSAVPLLTLRFEFGTLALFLYFLITDRKVLKPSFSLLCKTAFIGIFFYTGQSLLLFKSIEYIPASTASLILYFYPMMVLLISIFFLREKFVLSSLISVVLILFGCCLVFYDAFLRQISVRGLTYAVGAMLMFSTYLVSSQIIMKKENSSSASFYVMLFTCLGFITLNGGTELSGMTQNKLILAVCLGIIPSAIAMGLLYKGIEKIGAAYFSIFSSVEPVITLILAAVFLGENIVSYQIFGVILLVAGIIVPNMKFIRG
ncbi:MAG: DMT family transporter [Deferribacterales bacterium]